MGPLGTYTKLNWSFDTFLCRMIAKRREESSVLANPHIQADEYVTTTLPLP